MRQKYGLAVAILVLIATLMVPTPPELSTAGHRMLAVLLFSVIVWMSESVSYPVSASIIMTLMAFLLGTDGQCVRHEVIDEARIAAGVSVDSTKGSFADDAA